MDICFISAAAQKGDDGSEKLKGKIDVAKLNGAVAPSGDNGDDKSNGNKQKFVSNGDNQSLFESLVSFISNVDATGLEEKINNIVASKKKYKHLLIKDCDFGDANKRQQIFSELFNKLVVSGLVESIFVYEVGVKDNVSKSEDFYMNIIKIDIYKDKLTGAPAVIDAFNQNKMQNSTEVDKLLNVLDKVRNAHQYRFDLRARNMIAFLNKLDKHPKINSGKVSFNVTDLVNAEKLMYKCEISPNVSGVELDIKSGVIPNALIDLLMLKFPNCKHITSTTPINRGLADYIKNEYKGVHAPFNVLLDEWKIDDILQPLDANDKEIVRSTFNHIMSCDQRNHRPLMDALNIAVSSLRPSREMGSDGKSDRFRSLRILEYIANFPLGDTGIRFDFGDAAVEKHFHALNAIVDRVNGNMNVEMRHLFINHFIEFMVKGRVGETRPLFLKGQPGTGKTTDAKLLAYFVSYMHYFLPHDPSKYADPSDTDIQAAIEFSIENVEQFFLVLSMSSLSGKAAIDGGLKIYVGSEAGIIRYYSRKFYYHGKQRDVLFTVILFDEVDKMNEKGQPGEPAIAFSLMPFATTDAKAADLFCDIFGQVHPVLSVFAGNGEPVDFAALFNRMKKVDVPGFSNLHKRSLIFALIKSIMSGAFPSVFVNKADNGDIEIMAEGRLLAVIKNDVFNILINISGDDVGLRTLKDNISNLVSNISIECGRINAANNVETVIVDSSNLSKFLSFIVTIKNNEMKVGSSVCSVGIRDQKKAQLVKCNNNDNSSNSKINMSPGVIQKNHQQYHLSAQNNGSDIGSLTFNSLLEILKNPARSHSSKNIPLYNTIGSYIKSRDNASVNNHWVIDVEYNVDDDTSARIAGTSSILAYISAITNIPVKGFVIGYCDILGDLKSITNVSESFNLCLNQLLDLDKNDKGIHEKIVVILPKLADGEDAYKKLGITDNLRKVIEIHQADNIFDIVNILILGLSNGKIKS